MTDLFALPGDVEIIAHRGFSAEAPENTLVALRAGVDAGADAVEFDLHTAGDGTPVLLHDETLQRTTDGRGEVAQTSPAALASLDAGSWFGEAFAGEPLPTLARALDALPEPHLRIYAEVKGVRELGDLEGVVQVVRDREMVERTVFISMTWEYLTRIRAVEPRALLGYIVEKRRRGRDALAMAAGDPRALLDFDARILLKDADWARRAASKGIPLACWTVDSPDDAASLVAMGVPRITTNRVRDLVRWRDDRSGR